jgi:hypothetical protein
VSAEVQLREQSSCKLLALNKQLTLGTAAGLKNPCKPALVLLRRYDATLACSDSASTNLTSNLLHALLVQVRETLHANAEQKKRQMRKLEAQLAAKRNENATLALHLAGEQRIADCCL